VEYKDAVIENETREDLFSADYSTDDQAHEQDEEISDDDNSISLFQLQRNRNIGVHEALQHIQQLRQRKLFTDQTNIKTHKRRRSRVSAAFTQALQISDEEGEEGEMVEDKENLIY